MKTVSIPARDGYLLGGRVFEPEAIDARSRRVLIVHAATAIAQGFYGAFAQHLAGRGVTVITYDYRGIGASARRGEVLRTFPATMTDWARRDADGVHDWTARTYPGAVVSVLGHSFGGQILGLLENASHIHKALLVASASGYWRDMALRNQPRMLLYWYALFPAFLATLGYVPMKAFGAGEDVPGAAARQWRDWCLDPEYLFGELDARALAAYKAFPGEILAYSFSDDRLAGGVSAEKLLERYPEERVRLVRVTPRSVGADEIGHFGFFRSRFKDTLWEQAAHWLAPGPDPVS